MPKDKNNVKENNKENQKKYPKKLSPMKTKK